MALEKSSVDLAVVCNTDGLVTAVLYDALALSGKVGESFSSFVASTSQQVATEFFARLREAGTAFDCEMKVIVRGLTLALRFAGGYTGTGYCIIGTRANSAFGLMEALDELVQINNEQLNVIRFISQQREAVDRAARASAALDFDEITRLNNELIVAQRELSLRNAHLTRTLAELEHAHSEVATQRDEIERASIEIQRSNEELQQFAYVASHDLQAPLRHVEAFVGLLEAHYGQTLDERARKWMRHIVGGTKSMRSLVSGVLAYSRVETQGNPFSLVDMNEVVDSVRRTFDDAMRGVGATITRDELPTIDADALQMEQLMQNLLQNAITYRGNAPLSIHVGASQKGDEWKFSVRDNGIGIAAEHHEKIFSTLYRIHPQSKYPGTGLGLAICRQIVNRHHGSIWVEGAPDEGSTFFFTIRGSSAKTEEPS